MARLLVLIMSAFLFPAPRAAEQSARGCDLMEAERVIASLLLQHPKQARDTLECDPRLVEFARGRAQDMAERDYFGHVTPDRVGPNELLRASGYEMPKYYVGGIANSIESILAGEGEPDKAWKLLLSSSTHRSHLLGLDSMYVKQQRFGVAYFHKSESKYAHYWVIVIAESGTSKRPMTCTPAPAICIVH